MDKNSICYLSRFALNSAGLNLAAFNSSFETGCAGRKGDKRKKKRVKEREKQKERN